MKDVNVNINLVLSVSSSIIVLNGADGGDAVRVGTAMLQTQLGARHILQGSRMGNAIMDESECARNTSHDSMNQCLS